jgi:hypothetical protein
MMTAKGFGRRAAACVLTVTITFSTVPPVAARDAILGTTIVSGTAFSSTATSDWVKITGTVPLVSGDRLKTGKDSGLVADLHKHGVIGLYDDSEISVVEQGADIAVEALAGKVAFYLAPRSRIKLTASNATIAADTRKAEGYVEFNQQGVPELVVESDDVSVMVAGGAAKVYARGDRIVLSDAALAQAQVKVTTTDERKAGVVGPAPAKSRKKGGLSPLAWTAIGLAVVAAGVGAGVGLSGGGGGGDDTNGSE